ncbi:MAG: TonB-dependent receptor, partial [Sphingopyxis sp.]|nr:TonB-dependent receptor [Sphingopyxis sp.]
MKSHRQIQSHVARRSHVRMLAAALAYSSAGAALALGMAAPAHAQVAGASLRGNVKAEGGVSQVTAINVNTGLTRSVSVAANGSYNFASLPAGTYRLELTTPNGVRRTDDFTLNVAQSAVLDFDFSEPEIATGQGDDAITVTGTDSNIWLTKQLRIDRDYAAFGEISFDITDKLTLTGGGRLYKFDNSLVGFFGYSAGFSSRTGEAVCFAGPIVSGSPCTNLDKSTSDTDFIHKLNLNYKINDDVMIYGTWSRGFRPGGINRRGTLPPYGPDTLDNYEFGWKTSFGPIRFNGAIYQEDWTNIQLSFLGANGLTEIRNAGVARIRGVEADINYRQGGFTLSLGGSYNDATIRRDFCRIANPQFDCTIDPPGQTNALLAPAGSRLPVTAKFKGNAIARYEFPIGGMDGHVQFAANHIGKRRSDLRPFENGIVGNFKAYTTVDFS